MRYGSLFFKDIQKLFIARNNYSCKLMLKK